MTTATTTFDLKSLTLIGQGERSKVYQHPTDVDKVVKVTKSAEEKAVLRFLLSNAKPYFVKVSSIEMQGSTMYATIEKLADVEFVKFPTADGKLFFENAHMLVCDGLEYFLTRNPQGVDAYIDRQVSRLLAPESFVREYYSLLIQASKDGFWIPDVAWNLGRRADGSLCCYDASRVDA